MEDGCVIGNSGHFNVEINIPALDAMATSAQRPREHIGEYVMPGLVNLAAAEGHPATVMDMSFANQALAVAHLRTQRLKRGVP
jgi:adenosylhomocysteinase